MWALLLSLLSKLPAGLMTGFNIGTIVEPAIANIKTYWRFYLPVLLLIVQCGTIYEWRHTNTLLITERAAHSKDVADFKKAQADANAAAQTIKATLQKESKVNADQADTKYTSLLVQYRANLVRYQQAGKGGTVTTGYSQLPTPQGGDGPGASSVLPSIAISVDDANICAINTARLVAVHDWALNPPKESP